MTRHKKSSILSKAQLNVFQILYPYKYIIIIYYIYMVRNYNTILHKAQYKKYILYKYIINLIRSF